MLRSLRLRLLLGALGSILIGLVIAGFAIVASFSASIEAERRDDLSASIDRLTAAIDPAAPVLTVPPALTDPRYDTPLSGFYWQIADDDHGTVLGSRSLWDQQLSPPAGALPDDDKGLIGEISGPNGERLIMLTRRVAVESGDTPRHFTISVAEARSTDDDPIARFNSDLVIALCVLGAVLLVAAMVQVQVGLNPLERLDRYIRAVREGRRERLPQSRTNELIPITEQINELIDSHEETIGFSRTRAADLAHGLKTPLAVLSATAARLRAANNTVDADVLDLLTEQMNGRIEYQLRVARLRPRTKAMAVSASLNDAVLRSVAVLRKSERGERLNWIVNLETEFRVDVDAHDLLELAGILLENATEWAQRQVTVHCAAHRGMAELTIEDDGPGMTPAQIAQLGKRPRRLDEAVSVEGIGIAIALEIVRLNRGGITFGTGAGGGLAVTISLPLAVQPEGDASDAANASVEPARG